MKRSIRGMITFLLFLFIGSVFIAGVSADSSENLTCATLSNKVLAMERPPKVLVHNAGMTYCDLTLNTSADREGATINILYAPDDVSFQFEKERILDGIIISPGSTGWGSGEGYKYRVDKDNPKVSDGAYVYYAGTTGRCIISGQGTMTGSKYSKNEMQLFVNDTVALWKEIKSHQDVVVFCTPLEKPKPDTVIPEPSTGVVTNQTVGGLLCDLDMIGLLDGGIAQAYESGQASFAKTIIGKNQRVRLLVDKKEYYIVIDNGSITNTGEGVVDGATFEVSADSCAIQKVMSGELSPQDALEQGTITYKGLTFKNKVVSFIASIGLWFANLFS